MTKQVSTIFCVRAVILTA